jgi:hypothetical protein
MDGENCADAYREACVKSWQAVGGSVLSVNSRAEQVDTEDELPGVERVVVDSDGSIDCGKPLVHLDDLVRSASAAKDNVFIFTNSDIYFADSGELEKLAGELRAGEVVVSRRVNVESLREQRGETYLWGLDLCIGGT